MVRENDHLSHPAEGVKKLPEAEGSPPTYDITEWLANSGAQLSAGGKATYIPRTGTATITATEEDIDLADSLLKSLCCDGAMSVEITLSVVDFRLSVGTANPDAHWTYPDLKKKAIGALTVRSTLTFLTRSGQTVVSSAITRKRKEVAAETERPAEPKPEKPAVFETGESGMRATVEPVIGPDNISIDVNLDCSYRSERAETGEVDEFNVVTSLQAVTGAPTIVRMAKAPSLAKPPDQARFDILRALVISARPVTFTAPARPDNRH
jgi:hypothetical protein